MQDIGYVSARWVCACKKSCSLAEIVANILVASVEAFGAHCMFVRDRLDNIFVDAQYGGKPNAAASCERKLWSRSDLGLF